MSNWRCMDGKRRREFWKPAYGWTVRLLHDRGRWTLHYGDGTSRWVSYGGERQAKRVAGAFLEANLKPARLPQRVGREPGNYKEVVS